MPYDQLRDIAPVSRIGMMPNVLTVHPSVPLRSLKEFIAYARANPGKLSYASGLVGTSPQLAMEWFKLMTKTDLVNIPCIRTDIARWARVIKDARIPQQ